MNQKRYLVTNFAYGTGPYLRTTELAIEINNLLEKSIGERFGIIVPWVYGEKQKRIMLENFQKHDRTYPDEILLDKKLGSILEQVFYGNNVFKQALSVWVLKGNETDAQAQKHLTGSIKVETLSGKAIEISKPEIVLEINRAPRVFFNIKPSYYTSFAYISEILRKSLQEKIIPVEEGLLQKAVFKASELEKKQRMHFIAWPSTFSFEENRGPVYPTEILTPPITSMPLPDNRVIEPGIYVTLTGIPGLERLYQEAKKIGLKIYSNEPKAIPQSIKALPGIVFNKNILLHFARAGWGSIWLSQISETLFIAPEFDINDDPEMFFNNKCLEKLGLGKVYREQLLKELLEEAEKFKLRIREFNKELLKKFGTLDGNKYCAEFIAKDFLNLNYA